MKRLINCGLCFGLILTVGAVASDDHSRTSIESEASQNTGQTTFPLDFIKRYDLADKVDFSHSELADALKELETQSPTRRREPLRLLVKLPIAALSAMATDEIHSDGLRSLLATLVETKKASYPSLREQAEEDALQMGTIMAKVELKERVNTAAPIAQLLGIDASDFVRMSDAILSDKEPEKAARQASLLLSLARTDDAKSDKERFAKVHEALTKRLDGTNLQREKNPDNRGLFERLRLATEMLQFKLGTKVAQYSPEFHKHKDFAEALKSGYERADKLHRYYRWALDNAYERDPESNRLRVKNTEAQKWLKDGYFRSDPEKGKTRLQVALANGDTKGAETLLGLYSNANKDKYENLRRTRGSESYVDLMPWDDPLSDRFQAAQKAAFKRADANFENAAEDFYSIPGSLYLQRKPHYLMADDEEPAGILSSRKMQLSIAGGHATNPKRRGLQETLDGLKDDGLFSQYEPVRREDYQADLPTGEATKAYVRAAQHYRYEPRGGKITRVQPDMEELAEVSGTVSVGVARFLVGLPDQTSSQVANMIEDVVEDDIRLGVQTLVTAGAMNPEFVRMGESVQQEYQRFAANVRAYQQAQRLADDVEKNILPEASKWLNDLGELWEIPDPE